MPCQVRGENEAEITLWLPRPATGLYSNCSSTSSSCLREYEAAFVVKCFTNVCFVNPCRTFFRDDVNQRWNCFDLIVPGMIHAFPPKRAGLRGVKKNSRLAPWIHWRVRSKHRLTPRHICDEEILVSYGYRYWCTMDRDVFTQEVWLRTPRACLTIDLQSSSHFIKQLVPTVQHAVAAFCAIKWLYGSLTSSPISWTLFPPKNRPTRIRPTNLTEKFGPAKMNFNHTIFLVGPTRIIFSWYCLPWWCLTRRCSRKGPPGWIFDPKIFLVGATRMNFDLRSRDGDISLGLEPGLKSDETLHLPSYSSPIIKQTSLS